MIYVILTDNKLYLPVKTNLERDMSIYLINHLRARPLKVTVPDCCASEFPIDRLGSGLFSARRGSGLVTECLGLRTCHMLWGFKLLNPSLYCRLNCKVWSCYLWGWRQQSFLFDQIFVVALKVNVWSCQGAQKIKSKFILINFTDQSQSSLVVSQISAVPVPPCLPCFSLLSPLSPSCPTVSLKNRQCFVFLPLSAQLYAFFKFKLVFKANVQGFPKHI